MPGTLEYTTQSATSPYSIGQAITRVVETYEAHVEFTAEHHRLDQINQENQELHRNNEQLRSFYHMLSHELRTPLAAAREFVSIVLDGLAGALSEAQQEYLSMAIDSCDQLTLCLNDLLDAARLDTGKLSIMPQPTAISRVVSQAVAAMASTADNKGIRLQQVIALNLPQVLIDERRIAQVLINLLSNALKFTPTGGAVEVSVHDDPQKAAELRVSVSDTGRGIPAAELGHIFDRLYQTQPDDAAANGGLGLGLYISQAVVKLHGGEMWVESLLGKGSTFSFTVPKHMGYDL